MSRLSPRWLLLVLLGGGLVYWAYLKQPRELPVAIDLTSAMPGEISEVDVVVRRSGHVLSRHEVHSGAGGAPGMLRFTVRAAPGDAEVETTLVYPGKPAHRSVAQVKLDSSTPARIVAH